MAKSMNPRSGSVLTSLTVKLVANIQSSIPGFACIHQHSFHVGFSARTNVPLCLRR